MNISTFMSWFINKFIEIGTFMINKLGQITIYNNVSLLDFIIAITIIGMFINIVITIPTNVNKFASRYERKHRSRKEVKNDSE